MIFCRIDFWTMMALTGRDDLRNRIPPRLREFWTGPENYTEGIINWHKAHMVKTYCQETNGYACQRPAASINKLGDGNTGEYNMKSLFRPTIV